MPQIAPVGAAMARAEGARELSLGKRSRYPNFARHLDAQAKMFEELLQET